MNIRIDKKKLRWVLAMALFFLIAIVCVSFIFMPVKYGSGETVYTTPAISVQGLTSLGESWKRYPEYTVGLGIAAVLAFSGVIYCINNLYQEKEAG